MLRNFEDISDKFNECRTRSFVYGIWKKMITIQLDMYNAKSVQWKTGLCEFHDYVHFWLPGLPGTPVLCVRFVTVVPASTCSSPVTDTCVVCSCSDTFTSFHVLLSNDEHLWCVFVFWRVHLYLCVSALSPPFLFSRIMAAPRAV